ncbi:GntR family transcriptional regulator [Pseudoramibacter sp.]|jgi:DNA-binding GntR family transcriptional regulator|uniref:GntR family transcriptional regulator n=1 Tax=Pseudoramibacter sp. TaxID=2034862 RepID=UPI0025E613E5|nr:GntR family transcriptional regulator [Pseudoramibacter sp.]MCH4072105.1 GntR family transcriptional regulator [Pseudoramibacter sp.]MCH4105875.1 GntR family transcriptional regulator [Pseudoramibacter sp.]
MASQSTTAYKKIKEMIFHMELLPGDKISEPQISSLLEISRTPVHDALRKLSSEGLVTIGRNRGASVTKLSDKEIQDLGTIRLSQDILSANLAAYYGSAADFAKLYQMADICEEAAASGDVYRRITADKDFHLAIAKVSGNTYLYRQQYALYQQVHLIQITKYRDIQTSLIQVHLHRPLIESIQNSDLDRAATLLYDHIKDFHHLDPYVKQCFVHTACDEDKDPAPTLQTAK